jgi:hypothetical protein
MQVEQKRARVLWLEERAGRRFLRALPRAIRAATPATGRRLPPPGPIRPPLMVAPFAGACQGDEILEARRAPLAPEFFVILVDAAAAETTDQLVRCARPGFSQAGAVVDEADAKSGS